MGAGTILGATVHVEHSTSGASKICITELACALTFYFACVYISPNLFFFLLQRALTNLKNQLGPL